MLLYSDEYFLLVGISCRTAITIEDVLTTLSTLHVPINPNTG